MVEKMKKIFIISLFISLALFGCGGGGGGSSASPSVIGESVAPTPVLSTNNSFTSFVLQDTISNESYVGVISRIESQDTISIVTPPTVANDRIFRVLFETNGAQSVFIGNDIQISNENSRPFAASQVVEYRVVAQSGHERIYHVIRTNALSGNNSILTFSLRNIVSGESYVGVINQSNVNSSSSISVVTASQEDESFVATFTTNGAETVLIGDAIQQSGFTPNVFPQNTPVTYTVVAQNGSQQHYVVTRVLPTVTPMSPATVATGVAPSSIVIRPQGDYAYVTHTVESTIFMYSIQQGSGELVRLPADPVFSGGGQINSPVITQNGKYLYLANSQSSAVLSYQINDSNGVITPTVESRTGFPNPYIIALTHDDKYLYVGNDNGEIGMYHINTQNGELTEIASPINISGGGFVLGMAVDSINRHVYVITALNNDGKFIHAFTINESGALEPQFELTNPDYFPFALAINHSNKFLYIPLFGGNIVVLKIESDGGLTETGNVVIQATGPNSIQITSNDKFLFISDNASLFVAMYSLNSNSGNMTLEELFSSGEIFGVGGLAITPDDKYLYVANLGGNNQVFESTVSMYLLNQ